jgi:recombination protein RecA
MAKTKAATAAPASYFTSSKPELSFVSSGCTILDCALGNGWALGRVANIVGDASTAKTALACEAITNFLREYPNGRAAYRDAESAFDPHYAQAMGLPLDQVDIGDTKPPIITVEDFARDVDAFLQLQAKAGCPGIYVLDSLDALSDAAEMDREVGAATFGMAKAKLLSEFFRKSANTIENTKTLLLIVSQVRENIGVMFGEKYRRAGGKALDFYASQIVWLAKIETLKRTISKVERPYGVAIKAKVKKNKVGLAFREADFEFLFGYGVEDTFASINWLKKVGRITPAEAKEHLDRIAFMDGEDYRAEQANLAETVKTAWAEIETTFLPKRRKYD